MQPIPDLVEIVLPFHRIDEFLRTSIKSLIQSENVEVRVIAVNDSGMVIEKKEIGLRASDLLIPSKEKGYLGALATGVEISTAKWVGFQDSDDLTEPHRIFLQMRKIEYTNADVCTARIVRLNSNGSVTKIKSILGEVPQLSQNRAHLLLGAHGADSTIIARGDLLRTTWKFHGQFPAMFADYGWVLQLPRLVKIVNEDSAIYFYRSHNAQISRSARLVENWKTLHPLWLQNLEFNINKNNVDIDPSVSLSIAFPSALPRLNRNQKLNAIQTLKEISKIDGYAESTLWKKTLGRRAFILTRGRSLHYLSYGIGIAKDLIINKLKNADFKYRIGG